MAWEALAAIGEIVGAVGVVVSLLYLAYQIRQSRMALRAEASARAVESISALTANATAQPGRAQLLRSAMREPDRLSADDRFWAIQHVHQYLRQYEALHFQYVNGVLDRDLFQSYRKEFSETLAQPLFRTYWARKRDAFSSRFRDFLQAEAGLILASKTGTGPHSDGVR